MVQGRYVGVGSSSTKPSQFHVGPGGSPLPGSCRGPAYLTAFIAYPVALEIVRLCMKRQSRHLIDGHNETTKSTSRVTYGKPTL